MQSPVDGPPCNDTSKERLDDTQGDSANVQSAASRFFHNPDLCTLLNQALIANIQAALPPTAKVCESNAGTSCLLAFRGVTRAAYGCVMRERASRSALNLTPRDEFVEGVLVYTDPNSTPSGMVGAGQAPPFISRNRVDIDALLAVEIQDPEHRIRGGPRARMITHHPALSHQRGHYPPLEASLFILAEQYEICSKLPLACEMFLTQPPQKSIRFGIRYSYLPARQKWEYFTVNNEDGIRLGDLVEHLTREPGLMKQEINPKHPMYGLRKWLRDSEWNHMDRIVWEYPRAVVCDRRTVRWNGGI